MHTMRTLTFNIIINCLGFYQDVFPFEVIIERRGYKRQYSHSLINTLIQIPIGYVSQENDSHPQEITDAHSSWKQNKRTFMMTSSLVLCFFKGSQTMHFYSNTEQLQ